MQITVDGVAYMAQRLAWFYVTGQWPEHEIDHENTVKTDNRFENLRPATQAQNRRNCPARANNTTGAKGVVRHGKKFQAHIRADGKHYHLGTFCSVEEASAAYIDAAKRLHKEFARW